MNQRALFPPVERKPDATPIYIHDVDLILEALDLAQRMLMNVIVRYEELDEDGVGELAGEPIDYHIKTAQAEHNRITKTKANLFDRRYRTDVFRLTSSSPPPATTTGNELPDPF